MVFGVGQQCFYCSSRIKTEPAVTWAGSAGQIYLHSGCAADLTLRVAADLVRWQKSSGRRFGEALK